MIMRLTFVIMRPDLRDNAADQLRDNAADLRDNAADQLRDHLGNLRDHSKSFVIIGKSFVIIREQLCNNWEERRDNSDVFRDIFSCQFKDVAIIQEHK